LEVPLIRVPAKGTAGAPQPEVTLMDVDEEAVPPSVTAVLTDPTSTEGRNVGFPWAPSPLSGGPSESPTKKRRRVMFADE
jgi:hypothetical protein